MPASAKLGACDPIAHGLELAHDGLTGKLGAVFRTPIGDHDRALCLGVRSSPVVLHRAPAEDVDHVLPGPIGYLGHDAGESPILLRDLVLVFLEQCKEGRDLELSE